MASTYHLELAFLGAFGINAEAGDATAYDMNDGLVKAAAIDCAAHSYLVGEVRKVGMFAALNHSQPRLLHIFWASLR